MNLKSELLSICGALGDAEIPYALCGGMAVVLHGYPRLTKDIDLLIDPEDLERVRAALGEIGYNLPGGLIPFDVGGNYERRVFRVSRRFESDLLTIGLLLLPGFLRKVWDTREVYEV